MRYRPVISWPTIVVAIVIWGSYLASFWLYASVGPAAGLSVLFVVVGWYGSLRHESVHGHPTPVKPLNLMIAGLPLGLVYPFEIYRSSHLSHHRDENLTDPALDPESRYLSPEAWDRASLALRLSLRAERTLLGRLTVGVVREPLMFWGSSIPQSVADPAIRKVWLRHFVILAGILYLIHLSPIPVWAYVPVAIYGGVAGSLLRSFAEHAAVAEGTQCAVVKAGPIMSLYFLNLNLHHPHHMAPDVPWFELPALSQELGSEGLAREGAGLYEGGYAQIVRRFGLRPLGQPVHPLILESASK